MRYMYENFALTGKGVDSESYLEAVNQVTGSDFTDFFDKYFYGTEKFPIVSEFEGEEKNPRENIDWIWWLGLTSFAIFIVAFYFKKKRGQ